MAKRTGKHVSKSVPRTLEFRQFYHELALMDFWSKNDYAWFPMASWYPDCGRVHFKFVESGERPPD